MKKCYYFIYAILCILLLGGGQSFASSGETEYYINASGQYVATRSMWTNYYAPAGMGCNGGTGPDNDLVWGATFTPTKLVGSSSLILNGFPVSLDIFEAAVQNGMHGVHRNERGWTQSENMVNSNVFAEGVIKSVDLASRTVTLKFYTNYPGSCVSFIDSTFSFDASALMKHEGVSGTAASVLQVGRHVRIYTPRKQVVYSFSQDAIVFDRSASRSGTLGWQRVGFFHGIKGNNVYFTEKRNGE